MRHLRPPRHPLWRTQDRVRDVVVAVPARDEEDLLAACLQSVNASVRQLLRRSPALRATVVVALDGCTDSSGLIAAMHGALTVELDGVGVGRARDAAIEAGLLALGRPPSPATWIACTDADTIVPRTWLHRQVRLADRGNDLVIGTVEPFGVESRDVLDGWFARHTLREGHGHVHGANLGVRSSRWHLEGGFGAVVVGEDVALVDRIQAGRVPWLATDATRVRTSGRLVSRVESGFAGYLRSIDPRAPVTLAGLQQ